MTEYLLTPEEERMAILRAEYDKIQRIRFARKCGPEMDLMDTVKLTDEERARVLDKENKLKATKTYFDELVKSKRYEEAQVAKSLADEWTAKRFAEEMQKRSRDRYGVKLVLNQRTTPLIKAICMLLSHDHRYETECALNRNKGLILRGAPGLGKSWVIGLVADNPIRPVQIVTMHEIVRDILETGQSNRIKFNQYEYIYLDDVGTEYAGGERIKYFGTEINWFRTFIEMYYAKYPNHFHRLILSTNDNFTTMEEKYGFRVRDRLAEKFNVLDIEGESMRRK